MELNHYLILDGAQIDDLVKTIYKLQKTAQVDVLYLNTRFAELQDVSPVLVKVQPTDPLFQKFQTDWQTTAGIHILAKGDIYTLGNHLRSSLQAKINGQPTLFRFYDPRILKLWLETITPQQQSQFMGTITTLYLPATEDSQAKEYHNDQHLVCVTPDTVWIELNDQQLEHLTLAKKAVTKQQILQDLNQYFPDKLQRLNAEQQNLLVNTSINKAVQYGTDSPMDSYLWSILLLHKGLNFPDAADHQAYQTLLNNRQEMPTVRLDKAIAQLQQEQHQ